jgi:predicted O-methyltransferase YrrM
MRVLGGRKVDLLLIDGDHTYSGVKQDWKMYSPLVKKGGMVVFHDICHHEVFKECEVDRFWKEVKRGRRTSEIVDPTDVTWGGIGVIEV